MVCCATDILKDRWDVNLYVRHRAQSVAPISCPLAGGVCCWRAFFPFKHVETFCGDRPGVLLSEVGGTTVIWFQGLEDILLLGHTCFWRLQCHVERWDVLSNCVFCYHLSQAAHIPRRKNHVVWREFLKFVIEQGRGLESRKQFQQRMKRSCLHP